MSKSTDLKAAIDAACLILGVPTSYKENTSIKELTATLDSLEKQVAALNSQQDELNEELDGESNEELDSDLNEEIDGELNEELDSELNEELDSELNEEFDGESNEELDSELNEAPKDMQVTANSTFIYRKDGKNITVAAGETCLVPTSELDGEKGALRKGLARITV